MSLRQSPRLTPALLDANRRNAQKLLHTVVAVYEGGSRGWSRMEGHLPTGFVPLYARPGFRGLWPEMKARKSGPAAAVRAFTFKAGMLFLIKKLAGCILGKQKRAAAGCGARPERQEETVSCSAEPSKPECL